MTTPDPVLASTHWPYRGSRIESWLEVRRDTYPRWSNEWWAVQRLLLEYQLLAERGKALTGDADDMF